MMKKQLKWIIAIVVVIAVILMITYYQLYVTNTVYSAGISSKKIQQFDSSIAKLDKDNTIHQFFTAKRNNMERISLLFQDDENTKSGKIVIKLKNVTDDIAVKDETIEYVAALAKLDLTDEEKEKVSFDGCGRVMKSILKYQMRESCFFVRELDHELKDVYFHGKKQDYGINFEDTEQVYLVGKTSTR